LHQRIWCSHRGLLPCYLTLAISAPSLARDDRAIAATFPASFGLPFEQLQRYLFDSSPLILARVLPGQVIKLNLLILQSFIGFSARTLMEKSQRILNNKGYFVQGPHCYRCTHGACPFFPAKRQVEWMPVTMSEEELVWEMDLFLKNLPRVSTRSAELVPEEIKEGKENDAV
jgi:hypothetical protein